MAAISPTHTDPNLHALVKVQELFRIEERQILCKKTALAAVAMYLSSVTLGKSVLFGPWGGLPANE